MTQQVRLLTIISTDLQGALHSLCYRHKEKNENIMSTGLSLQEKEHNTCSLPRRLEQKYFLAR